jgi:dTDP-glucose 4,6-dehydratase
MTKILVTGGAGFIGSALCRRLVQKGERVVCVDAPAALDLVADIGIPGAVYNVSGSAEVRNLDLARIICRSLDAKLGSPKSGSREGLIKYVIDRPDHDHRYVLAGDRLKELGCAPKTTLESGIEQTIDSYLARQDWCEHVRGSFSKERQRRRAAL